MSDRLKRLLSAPLAVLLLSYDALDALFGPLVRPVIAWAASLHMFQRLGAAIGALPPYAALALLAVPEAAIEPFKFVALWWFAQGDMVTGVVALAGAHLASLLICERIFHAAKAQLLTIGWFARGYSFVTQLRDRALAWLRATAVWRAGREFAIRIRTTVRLRLGR